MKTAAEYGLTQAQYDELLDTAQGGAIINDRVGKDAASLGRDADDYLLGPTDAANELIHNGLFTELLSDEEFEAGLIYDLEPKIAAFIADYRAEHPENKGFDAID